MSQDTQIKKEKRQCAKTNKKYEVTLVKHKCSCCISCWYILEEGYCIFGGPFSGYKYYEE